ncbi:MAG: anthranilate phosphoribosyltransferase family protein [Microcoleaceae cyanobacterium]
MSDRFRELLKKVGSGPHTGQSLNREEARDALGMMLQQEATPAQIGAFLIAHRIKRPTGAELAGMLDVYDELGPHLTAPSTPTIVLGCPYDGRSRTAPVTPLTALILATAGVSVVLHGGDRMPTKEGIPLIEIWQNLGIDWDRLSLEQVQQVLNQAGIGFIYLPTHFPLATALVSYRRQIGKRPPISTMELIWSPCLGDVTVAAGYVHPPTEGMFQDALSLRGISNYITVKGLEGSCDLPRDRTCIIGAYQPHFLADDTINGLERLLLHPTDYGLANSEIPLTSTSDLIDQIKSVLAGEENEMMKAAIWNGGFYLWRMGACSDLNLGLLKAKNLLTSGAVTEKFNQLSRMTQDLTNLFQQTH